MLSVLVFSMIYFPPCSFGKGKPRFSPVVQRYTSADTTNQESLKDDKKITITSDSLIVSSRPPVNPTTAMYHSLAFPGWGQVDNGKKKKAAFFFIAEMVCIGGYLYTNHELKHGDYTQFQQNNLRTDRNTFILYWMISKIFGILDAYVDAQLVNYDVNSITPDDLKKE